jgi:ribosomal protein S18 acetylase RimI-like enzyme
MPQILAIERASFNRPASELRFREALQRGMIGIVADCQGRIDGFSFYEPMVRTILLRNLAVAPAVRGRGIGLKLIARMARSLVQGRHDRIEAHVLAELLEAQLFLRGIGFEAVPWPTGRYVLEMPSGDEVFCMRWSLVDGMDTGCER